MNDTPIPPLGTPSYSEQEYYEKKQQELMGWMSFSYPSSAPWTRTCYIIVNDRKEQVYVYHDKLKDLFIALDPVVQCLWNVGRETDKWDHLLNISDGADKRTAIEKHVKTMINSCPPGFFKNEETLLETSCRIWNSRF
jgi:hypothetical protein